MIFYFICYLNLSLDANFVFDCSFFQQIKTQTKFKTWTTDGNQLISHIVHYDTKIQKFVGIFAGKYLRTWTEEEENISKLKKYKLYRPVHAVTVADDGQIIILYKNSICESVSCALQLVQDRKLGDLSQRAHRELELGDAFDVKCFTTKNFGHIFSFCIREGDSNVIELNLVSLQEDTLQQNGSYKKITIDNSSANHARLLGCTVMDYNNEPTLITLWTNRDLFARPFFSENTDSPLGEFIANLSFISTEYPVTMTAVGGKGSPYIAFYACNNNLDGATLFMFNLQYRIIQSRQPFKVFFQLANLDTFDSYIFLDAGQYVNAINYRITLDKLASLIGSRREMISFEQLMSTECYDAVSMRIGKESLKSTIDKFKRNQYFFKDKNKFHFAKRDYENHFTVDEQIRELCDDFLPINIIESDQVTDLELLVTPNSNCGQRFETRFEILAKEMENFGCSETEIAEKLIYLFLKANLTDQIVVALQRFTNVTEETVVRLLKYALEVVDTSKKSDTIDLINVILLCSYHVPAIVPQIRKHLTSDDIKNLLQHLYSTYTSANQQSGGFDDDRKILGWVNVLIDASYQYVMLTNDQEYSVIFDKWTNIIKFHIEDLKELEKLRPLVYEITRGRTIKKPTRLCRWYNIEKINLW